MISFYSEFLTHVPLLQVWLQQSNQVPQEPPFFVHANAFGGSLSTSGSAETRVRINTTAFAANDLKFMNGIPPQESLYIILDPGGGGVKENVK